MAYVVASSPHMHDKSTTASIMGWVCLSLVPALLWAWLVFGLAALFVAFICVFSCVLTEAVCCKMRRLPVFGNVGIRDGSAAVTGILLACVLPSNIPLYLAFLGGVFAIGIGKQAFGGLGANIWNPALLGRAFLQISRPLEMNSPEFPYLTLSGSNLFRYISGSFEDINAIAKENVTDNLQTSATALVELSHSASSSELFWKTFWGIEGGSLGEVSAILLLLGGLFLLWKKIITWEIPVLFMGTTAILSCILPATLADGGYSDWFSGAWHIHLAGGGLMLGAWFMATDPVSSPLTSKGRLVFGAGCGILTVIIRLYGGYPEGVCYAILLMNMCVPLIDSYTKPKVFGH